MSQTEQNHENTEVNEKKIGIKTLRQMFWRLQLIQGSWNYERMQALGYLYCFKPVLKLLYKTETERADAMKRHLEFFNSHPTMVAPILGINAAIEEKGGEQMKAGVNGVKVGLMGPLAGVGDSILWLTWLPIAMSIGVSFAMAGNIIGPILALLLFNLVNIPLKYYGIKMGYEKGVSFLYDAEHSNVIQRYTQMALVLGLVVIGGLIPQIVKVTTPYVLAIGKTKLKFQEIFDGVLPSLLPLLVTFLCFIMIRKGVNPIKILFGIITLSILGKWVGIL